jgi:pimeloyl-ACP methyl ester carboxylesterase
MGSHYYEWSLGRVHYKKSGLGDPILLVHGLYPGASSEEFDHNIRALSRNFRVYAIDLLGFGLSDAPRIRYRADLYPLLLEDFIQDVIDSPAHAVAAGASCSYIATVAVLRPDLVSKVVFISPQCAAPITGRARWLTRTGQELLRALFLIPPFHLLFQEAMAGEWEMGEMLRRSSQARTFTGKIERLSELARMPGVLWAYASLEVGLLSMSLDASLRDLPVPALFISGTGVDRESAAITEASARLPRHSRMEWIERASSWVHQDMAAQANRLIAGFLESETASGNDISPPARAVA